MSDAISENASYEKEWQAAPATLLPCDRCSHYRSGMLKMDIGGHAMTFCGPCLGDLLSQRLNVMTPAERVQYAEAFPRLRRPKAHKAAE